MKMLLKLWFNSIKFLMPEQSGQLGLIILNTLLRMYRYLLRSFLVLFFLGAATIMILRPQEGGIVGLLLLLSIELWIFSLYLSARSSVMQKNWSYFLHYIKYLVYIFIMHMIAVLFFSIIALFYNSTRLFFLNSLLTVASLFFAAISLLFPFFLLDHKSTFVSIVQSLRKAVRMAWYSAPLFICVNGFFLLVVFFIEYVNRALAISYTFTQVIFLLLMSITIALYGVLYTKLLYA
jgi:hypothetical protein